MQISTGLLPARKPDSYKGDYGRVLVLGGSRGMSGAVTLCGLGALRAGAGLVRVAVPEPIQSVVAAKVVEAMTVPLPAGAKGVLSAKALSAIAALLEWADVAAVGPGLSQDAQIRTMVRGLLGRVKIPVVLDADALDAMANAPALLKKTRASIVVTPHPGEMARLAGTDVKTIQRNRVETAQRFAQSFNVVVVLKGSETVVAAPSGLPYINESGNPGMASGGMGDVLTGIIAALLGQKLSPFDAARLGVYLHGLAGDIAAKEIGEIGLIATDVAARIPAAVRCYQQVITDRC